jgi:hypothetical protein
MSFIFGYCAYWNYPEWVTQWPALAILRFCRDYPALPWRELSAAQRKELLLHFGKVRPTPIITDVRTLDAAKIFDKFKQAAADAREYKKSAMSCPATAKYDAVEHVEHVVFSINYKDGIDAVKTGIFSWLGSSENQKRFKLCHPKSIDKKNPYSPVRSKERLKSLAAWRLYDELGHDGAKKWTKKNRRCEDSFHLKAFFREKPSKGLNVSPLYKEKRDWEAAIAAAKTFLAMEIECGVSGVT